MVNCVSVLGSTGSIGRQSLDIISRLPVRVAALTAGTSVELMAEQCREFKPALAVMATKEAAEKLAESIRFYFTNRKIVYIMGMFRDKEYEKVIRITAPLASQIITVAAPENPRALPALDLAVAVREVNPHVTNADSLEEAVEMSYLFADKDSVIIAFGSLAFLGQLMTIVEGNQTVRSDTHGK